MQISAVENKYKRSSYCGTNACVEVAIGDDVVSVRDSKNLEAGELRFTHDEWRAFVIGVKADELSLPEVPASV